MSARVWKKRRHHKHLLRWFKLLGEFIGAALPYGSDPRRTYRIATIDTRDLQGESPSQGALTVVDALRYAELAALVRADRAKG